MGETRMRMAKKSDVGRIRTVNEDRVFARTNGHHVTIAIVADGMGGHQAGDIASLKATQTIQEHLIGLKQGLPGEVYKEQVREAIKKANQTVYQSSLQEEKYNGMGTTVVTTLISDQQVVIGHIGDSRAYHYRAGVLTQLTEDHSLVNELVKSGQITAEEAKHHPRRNVLVRALGTDAEVEVDVQAFTWLPEDLLLLCTDGLSGMLGYDGILNILRENKHIDQMVNQLVEGALAAGGDDNVTVILLANVEHQEESGVKS